MKENLITNTFLSNSKFYSKNFFRNGFFNSFNKQMIYLTVKKCFLWEFTNFFFNYRGILVDILIHCVHNL